MTYLTEPNSGVLYRRYCRAKLALTSFPIGEKLELIPSSFESVYDRFMYDHLKASELAATFTRVLRYVAINQRPRSDVKVFL